MLNYNLNCYKVWKVNGLQKQNHIILSLITKLDNCTLKMLFISLFFSKQTISLAKFPLTKTV